jgi:hypothetical protein
MTQISNNQNLNAHYSSNAKVQRSTKSIANAPSSLPNNKMPYYDKDATKRMQAINDSIYKDYQAEKKQNSSSAVKFVSATALAILCALGIKKMFFK